MPVESVDAPHDARAGSWRCGRLLGPGESAGGVPRAFAGPPPTDKALIAITLDLEMSRNFPTWDQTHWDYEKGNLDAETKRYAVEAARRVKAHGRRDPLLRRRPALEQEDVGWLKEIVAQGHPVGNHTYDHVNVKATRPRTSSSASAGRPG